MKINRRMKKCPSCGGEVLISLYECKACGHSFKQHAGVLKQSVIENFRKQVDEIKANRLKK